MGRDHSYTMTFALIALALLLGVVTVQSATGDNLQLSYKYKTGGTMEPNICGTWKFGTVGRAGESVNPFCKATERDTGTTGTVHLSANIDSSAFEQSVKFGAPNTYEMSTKYWSDPPCQSGEEFARCSEPDIPQTNDVCPPNFESIDTDKNGKISASEWRAVFEERAEPIISGLPPQWVFPNGTNTADTNNDGELSQQEYETYQPVVFTGDALPAKPDKCRPAKPDDMTQAEYDEQYPRSNYRCYTSPICTQEACKCMMTCCEGECPKSVCLKDTHGSCELKDRGTCPMWPQCIINGNCDEKKPTCGGVAGAPNGQTCAFVYPGCGAAGAAQKNSIMYNGADPVQFLTIVATGTIVPAPVLDTVRMSKMCGAHNNMFSYKNAGSASLLATAPAVPTFPYVLGGEQKSQSCCLPAGGCAGEDCPCSEDTVIGGESFSGDQVTSGCKCKSGHPTYCECSSLVEISITKILVTVNDAALAASIDCPCAPAVNGDSVDMSACTTTTCPFLQTVGYNSNNGKYYAQKFRPPTIENALYLSHQRLTADEALNSTIHAEGVYTLETVCAACSIRARGVVTTMIAALLGTYLFIQ